MTTKADTAAVARTCYNPVTCDVCPGCDLSITANGPWAWFTGHRTHMACIPHGAPIELHPETPIP
jgi:hypothetical protein